ncbi:MAG: 3-hydroxyacyl-CoA dehydrogenase family protein [Acidimicrobiia bacterium]|nr:MAG: 3-hydroxyacyl-CoA dehydrogenase family protein [Acidimicrobiia bacterium]
MKVGVIGGGTMGVGIAYRFAVAGASVHLADLDLDHAQRSVALVRSSLERAVERGKLARETAAQAGARVVAVSSIDDLPQGLALIVEAVVEDLGVKADLLWAAERRRPAVLASNTSSISIDDLAAGLEAPQSFAGMHFFNPVWAIHLVEVVRGSATSDSTLAAILETVEFLGMEAAVVNDVPGFASSRLGIVLGLEAIRMVEEGVAEPEDIDRAMELGYRHAMGPLRTGDLVGLDVRLAIAEHLAGVYGERFEPPALLRTMVEEGKLGRKSGEGFYVWPPQG